MIAQITPSLGMFPAISDEKLPAGAAVLAQNCRLNGAKLRPWKGLGSALAQVDPGTVSIFKYDADKWFQWGEDADVSRSQIAGDTTGRVYFTREGLGAFYTYDAIATTGPGPYPTLAYPLGIPAPATPPVLTWAYSGEGLTKAGDVGNQLVSISIAGASLTNSNAGVFYWGLSVKTPNALTVAGDDLAQLSGLTLTGATGANTDEGKLYFSISDLAGTRTVSIYKSAGTKVAEGSLAGDGVVTLAEVGGSGITGSVTITYAGDDAFSTDNLITLEKEIVLYKDSAGASPVSSGTFYVDGDVILSEESGSGVTGTITIAYTADDTDTANNTLTIDDMTETKSYVYTYVDVVGAEGPPSFAGEAFLVPPGAVVTLSLPSSAPAGYDNIVTIRIYRTLTGSTSTDYQFVDDVLVTAGTYEDAVLDADLGEVLPSLEWDAPPDDMMGIVAHPAGFMVGFSKNTLCLSEKYLPHAWPVSYQITVDNDIVGVGVFGMSIIVLTSGPPVLVTGQDPGAMSVERYESGLACVSKRSIVDLGEAIIYASAEGMVLVSTGRVELITKEHFTADEWSVYSPATISAFCWDGNYVGFYGSGSGGFIFTRQGQFSLLSDYAVAGYRDNASGELYLVIGADIKQWQGSSEKMTATFQTGVITLPRLLNMGCAQVVASGYPLTFYLYADGVLKMTKTVTDHAVFRLPGGFLSDRYQAKIETTYDVDSIVLAGTMGEMRQV